MTNGEKQFIRQMARLCVEMHPIQRAREEASKARAMLRTDEEREEFDCYTRSLRKEVYDDASN